MTRVAVSVGTDHHRFDRLVEWVESWHRRNPDAALTVQHGATRPCRSATNVSMISPDEVVALYADSDVVVLQGGPGGILDARRAGRIPIVVPRVARLHEVVDDHQVDFARRLARQGLIVVAESESSLHTLLDTHRATVAEGPVTAPEGVRRAVAALSRPPAPLPRGARLRRSRSLPKLLFKALRGH